MWTQLKPKTPNVMMFLQYEDFATIEVEKRTNKSSDFIYYNVNIEIFDLLTQSLIFNELKSMEPILIEIKKDIEEFYNQSPLMNDEEIENWQNEFIEKINEY